ncbi:MAG: molybdopterin-dependent oxidoreductase [Candidatus Omnitrophica bacterium]|nr:molybdopterin-dependent oxidoreductase [Candidatus Omnitrophota bacterium]
MVKLTRRNLIRLGIASAAVLTGADKLFGKQPILSGKLKLEEGGRDFSPKSGKERKVIPTACWQCVSRDAVVCYVEDGKLVKIEGNPESIRNRGKICAKGQAGINQVYDPDRILYPMKRAGRRGEGKWKRISWDEALNELTTRLKKLLDEGHPEKFMFHYGRMKGSDDKIIKDNFLPAYGTGTIGDHTSICEGAKWVAQELTWGKHYDVNDVPHANMILNFGCNIMEAHTSHIQLSQRTIEAMAERGTRLITFDVRLSNTAAKSTEWIPIKPGTDGAVVLAMANVVMQEELYDSDFINKWTNVTVDELKSHLKQYTPEWAEKISGVSASKIRSLAIEYGRARPGTIVSYRGAVAHYNGVETERAIKMLDAILGNIDVKGGTCRAVSAKWSYPKAEGKQEKLKIIDGLKGDAIYPTHHINHRVFKTIKEGSNGRPDVYMIYCYEPVYANGEVQENIDIMKDEKLLPYIVAVNPFYTESTALADLILPDVTYLERWSWDDMVSYEHIGEFYIRQPVVKAPGQVRQFQDVACDLAKRLGLKLDFDSAEDFVKKSCEKSKVDFEYLKKHGVWHNPEDKPKYKSYAKELKQEQYTAENVLLDAATGVYWDWKKSKAKTVEEVQEKGYTATKDAYKGYVGQKIGSSVYAGFKPDKLNKSGLFEISSNFLKKEGYNPLPSYFPVPEHENMKKDEMILTTYKVGVQIHSRSQNCKWLTEIYHENPAWINPATAKSKGIKDGDKIKVKSRVGDIITKAKLTEGVHPQVIAISHHLGHWEYGAYASGRGCKDYPTHVCEPDCHNKWWKGVGVHPNWIIPNSPDPIAGQLRFMDTVVEVTRA